MPKFQFHDSDRRETGPGARMADIAVAEPLDLHQHRVVVAIDEDVDDLELVARGLALRPQGVARAAEERGVAGALRVGERLLVHEADHQHFRRLGVLDHCGNETVQF